MKFFIIVALFGTYSAVYSQDCTTLEKFNSFHELKFGMPFPDSLKQYCHLNVSDSYDDFMLLPDKLSLKDAIKFSKWLYFGDVFDDITISVLKDKRMFCFSLSKKTNSNDSSDIANSKLPASYNVISDELKSLFGEMSTFKNSPPSPINMNSYKRVWECENIRVELTLIYGMLHSISLEFIDKNLEKIQKLAQYTK